jgi:hypothetical protein
MAMKKKTIMGSKKSTVAVNMKCVLPKLTPWSRVHEKLISLCTEIVEKIFNFHSTRKYITVFARAR